MATLQQIFKWFVTGAFPTEQQFKETYSSFWHKSEKIPVSQISDLETIIGNSLEQFREVFPSGRNLTVDHKQTPYSIVELKGNQNVFDLSITNMAEDTKGKILILNGGKTIALSSDIQGSVSLPKSSGTIVLLTYHKISDIIYLYQDIILGGEVFPKPSRIEDFLALYYDNMTCIVQWTAPYGNDMEDIVTEYDIRYASTPVNADDPAVWNSLKQLSSLPVPEIYGTIQKYSINGLTANSEYYCYIKSIKINNGVRYVSLASDAVHFKTKSDLNMEGYYRLALHDNMLSPRTNGIIMHEGHLCLLENILDEEEKDIYNPDGYPDTENKAYETSWRLDFNNLYNPWQFVIDLHTPCVLDKLFLYAIKNNTGTFRVFLASEIGATPEYVTTVDSHHNTCVVADLQGKTARLILLKYDNDYFGINQANVADGNEFVPTESVGNNIGYISRLLIYGRRVIDKPLSILPPVRSKIAPHTVDEFFNVVGWFYQQGRIFSLCSGSRVRLFGSSGHFCPDGPEFMPTRMADVKGRPNDINWVKSNNGTGHAFRRHLEETFAKYGLKPFTASSSFPSILRLYDEKGNRLETKSLDNHWLPDAWKPLPSKGLRGYEKYFRETMNPNNYRTIAKVYNILAAIYGKSTGVDIQNLNIYPQGDEAKLATGLDLMCGQEVGNEEERTWEGWMRYTQPQEAAAWMSAAYDGHCGTLTDEEGNGWKYGMKRVSPDSLVIWPGLVGINPGYFWEAYLWAKENRPDGKFPADVLNVHTYFSNKWKSGHLSSDPSFAVTMEENMSWAGDMGPRLEKLIDFRNRYLPDKEIWITEFGYGESGGEGTQSQYQCYSQKGRYINDWLIPDRHRSEVKGAWIVRAALTMMRLGIDACHCYSIEMDSYFDTSQYGSGAGFEMFHWNDEPSNEPGAKYEAIKKHVVNHERTGFATTGLFNSLLWCGGYPITRSFWWVSTFRNRLKGYVYTGQKFLDQDSRLKIMCFKKQGEDKGAYVAYLNDSVNSGVPNVRIPLPAGVSHVTKVTTYCPEIVNPETMPYTLEYDEYRTGLPTTRREKYIDGQWVIQNAMYGNRYESFAQGPADYPENPQEGDEVYVLPTPEENPYFPIVGPVGAISSIHMQKPSANEYEWIDPADPILPNGDPKWSMKGNVALSWRQVNAICDYIQYTEEGKHGTHGDEEVLPVTGNVLIDHISEFPNYYFFDGVPEPDYKGYVTDVTAVTVNSSTIKLYWNNHLADDTAYEIFMSTLPESGYTVFKTVAAGLDNYTEISGLEPDSTYYFKVRPRKDNQTGELSEAAFAKTYSLVPAIQNLRVTGRSATTVSLEWSYAVSLPDFVSYAIYRAKAGGGYSLIAKGMDQSVNEFRDINLNPGTAYQYKIRVYTLSGFSEYSNEVDVRTLTVEESAPQLLEAYTDKLGSKVTLVFDLPIKPFDTTLKSQFTLTENGGGRLIFSAKIDESNPTNIILMLNEGAISDYDSGTELFLSYTRPAESPIVTIYGVALESFLNYRVVNNTGNIGNLRAVYRINLTDNASDMPQSEWNNLLAHIDEEGAVTRPDVLTLVDTYGRTSDRKISAVTSGIYRWGGVQNDRGQTTLPDVEENVANTSWRIDYNALVTENIVARLKLENLNPEYKYTIKAYPYVRNYATVEADQRTRIKVNGVYSNFVDAGNNADGLVVIEDATPDASGELLIDFLPMREVTGYSVCYCLLYLEEYASNNDAGDTNVWIRNLYILQDEGNGVKDPEVTVHVNSIGEVSHYRIAESEEALENALWQNYPGADIPYRLSDGYTQKTIYLQLKNNETESNVRYVSVQYNDPYVPLVLKNVYINHDDEVTYTNQVSVFVEMEGMATQYRISEDAGMQGAVWQPWPEGATIVPFTMNEAAGQKTVYVQLKDNITETAIKADTINYSIIEYDEVTLRLRLPVVPSVADISFAPLKYNKRFAYGLTSDDTHVSAWNVLFKYFNGQWMDDAEYFHKLANNGTPNEPTTGTYAPRALTYTDGCGIKRRFTVNTANWYNLNANNFDNGGGWRYPYLLWPEIEEMLDFDGDMSIHDVRDPVLGENGATGGTVENILNGINAANEYVYNRIMRKLMVVTQPGNDTLYMTAAQAHPDIRMGTSGQMPYISLLDENLNPDKIIMGRYFSEGQTLDHYKQAFLQQIATPGFCGEFGVHGADRNKDKVNKDWPAISGFFDWLCDTYGEYGNDEMWFATNGEISQYMSLKKHSIIEYTVQDYDILITLRIPKFENYQWRELTLILSMNGNPVDITESGNITGLSYNRLSDGNYMINVNLDQTLISRAEKYTAKFEDNPIAVNKNDAEYFIQRLKPSLRAPFQARINAMTSVPVITSFEINDGAETTQDNVVTCKFTHTGMISHYMISDNSLFAGASWQAYSGNEISFNLALNEGNHTIYFKVKNDYGTSEVVSDSINFQPAPIELKSVLINGGEAATLDKNVVINFTYAGLPTHYRIGTSQDLSVTAWNVFTGDDIAYVLDDNTFGKKVIYAQLKSAIASSEVVSGEIILNDASIVKAVISFSADRPGSGTYPSSANYPVVNGEIINYIAPNRHVSYVNTPIKNTYGGDFGAFLAKHEYPDDGITYVQGIYEFNVEPVEGIYPNTYIRKSLCGETKTETNRIRFDFRDIEPGNYRVKILASSNNGNTNTEAKRNNCFYVVNGVTVSPTFDLQGNSTQYIVADVSVDIDGILYVSYYNTIPAGTTPCLNLIEILKQ